MEFGQWIASIGEQKGISLRAFARQIGIEFSTLQRLEKAQAEPTLRTAFQICRGLKMTLDHMLDGLQGASPISTNDANRADQDQSPRFIVTREDILDFSASDEVYIGIIQTIFSLLGKGDGIKQEESALKPDEAFPSLFVKLSSLERAIAIPPAFRVVLTYPPQIGLDDLFNIYTLGGALSLEEIGRMVRAKRLEKGTQTQFRAQLQGFTATTTGGSKTSKSISTLSRIESGKVANIKLKDVLAIDAVLSDNHDIMRMYWNAPALERGRVETLARIWTGLDADLLITLCRWLMLLYDDDSSWLERLRAEVGTGNSRTA